VTNWSVQANALFNSDSVGDSTQLSHNLHFVHRQHLSTILEKNSLSYSALESELRIGSNSSTAFWFQRENEDNVPYLALLFLAVGFGLMTGGAIYFLVSAIRFDDNEPGPTGPLFHYIAFFITSISALSYYAMWNGSGIVDTGAPREASIGQHQIVFVSRYVDRLLTSPLIVAALAVLSKAPLASIIALLGCDLLMIGSAFFGALIGTADRYLWWGASVAFLGVLVYLLLTEQRKATQLRGLDGEAGETIGVLTYITIAALLVYPVLWLLGQEGAGVVSLNLQVTFELLADLASKLIFGAVLVNHVPSSRRFSTFV
jgi:bacteriorhodopsin